MIKIIVTFPTLIAVSHVSTGVSRNLSSKSRHIFLLFTFPGLAGRRQSHGS